MTPILEVSHLTKRFGGLVAVHDVTFNVAPSEVVGILGPNGAGKTTLYNLLTGFISFDEGSVVFQGTSLKGLSPHKIAQMGISRTFQLCRPFVGMTVEENVRVGGLSQPAPAEGRNEHALRLLDEVGLADLAHRPVEELPYGKLRLVEIARALASDPLLICLDEPAAGLNPSEVEQVGQTLRGLEKRGVALLLVEHNMKLVFSVVDELTVLHHGSVIAQGDPATVREHPEVLEAYLGSRRGE